MQGHNTAAGVDFAVHRRAMLEPPQLSLLTLVHVRRCNYRILIAVAHPRTLGGSAVAPSGSGGGSKSFHTHFLLL